MSSKYDYIITGAGAAGLSLLVHLIHSGKFSTKRILLLDKSRKDVNDRTWCFWETSHGLFEDIVHTRYEKLWFHSEGYSELHNISPYEYKLTRGIDFYERCFEIIDNALNVTVQYGNVQSCVSDTSGTYVVFDDVKIYADYIFNSILFDKPAMGKNEYYLLQHFKGWVINVGDNNLNPSEATLMDFRVDQSKGTAFVYVMPFSERQLLVEYTLFSKELLKDEEYDEGLRKYITERITSDYSVISEEFGIIPMTNYKFPSRINNIINIGTAGGMTKASSGYTFQFIQKHSRALTEALIKTGKPVVKHSFLGKRFGLYDATLLNILYNETLAGAGIFSTLIQHNPLTQVLKFLDNETSLPEELKLISPLPKSVFFSSALKQL